MCTITPGSGRSASTRIAPASTVSAAEAPAQHREVVEPVEQRQHEPRARHPRDPLQRLLAGPWPWSPRSARRPAPPASRARAGARRNHPGARCSRADRARRSAARSARARSRSRALPARPSAPASRPPTPPGPSTANFIAGAVDQHPRGSSRTHAGIHDSARVDRGLRPAQRRRTAPGAGGHTRAGGRARPRGGG